MKKYNVIRITNTEGITEFEGSYTKLLRKFNNQEECNEYIDNCKELGYDCSSRTTYYDFEYNGEGLSKNWLEDIKCEIIYENSRELIEEIIKKSFKDINRVRCDFIGEYLLVVLPKIYDSFILQRYEDIDHKLFRRIFEEISLNINGRHNKTNTPKIFVAEFVNNWRTKIKYADYNEGYRFYYNSKPDINRLRLLLK